MLQISMNVILLGLIIIGTLPSLAFSMEDSETPAKITTEQYQILKAFFSKKTGAIGRLTAELAKPWEHSNIPTWVDAQVQIRQNKYYDERKLLAIQAFLSTGLSGVSGYLCISDQVSKPEIKIGAAAVGLASAAYSLNTVYEYCVLRFPTQEMLVKELEKLSQSSTDVDWQIELLQEIAGKYPLMISKK